MYIVATHSSRSSERMKRILDLIIRSSSATGGADDGRTDAALEGGSSFLDEGRKAIAIAREGRAALLSELPKRGNILQFFSSPLLLISE